MSIPKNHYFNPVPEVASKRHTVRLHTGELDLELQADRGVFGARRVDLGTLTLLKEAPAPPAEGDILDLGAGYGPIAIALARASPDARIWAVDVNQRALELSRANAEAAGVANVTVAAPDEVPEGVRFAAIYSNPPVRIGKAALHAILERWLDRLPGRAAQPGLGLIGRLAGGLRPRCGPAEIQKGLPDPARPGGVGARGGPDREPCSSSVSIRERCRKSCSG